MSALSIARDGKPPFVIAASPLFTLNAKPPYGEAGRVVFEIFERDAEVLQSLLGKYENYAMDGEAFVGKIVSLEPCVSTHPGLGLMRDRPMRWPPNPGQVAKRESRP